MKLRIGKNTGQGQDAGGGPNRAAEEEPVEGVTGDGRRAAAVAGGDGIDPDRDTRPGVEKWVVGSSTRRCRGGIELVAAGAAAAKDTRVAKTELPEQPIESEFLEVVLRDFHKFRFDLDL